MIIDKPKSFQELLKYLNNKSKSYEIFIYDKNFIKIIDNEEKYEIIKDIIFLKELDNLDKSIFSMNYDNLTESKQDILDKKYNCILCTNLIKKEKPYICYQCQKIFHEKCLKDWDNKWKLHHKNFECPNCRNILSLENWKKKLDHEDDRIENANLLNNINELKLVNNVSSIINIIQDKK